MNSKITLMALMGLFCLLVNCTQELRLNEQTKATYLQKGNAIVAESAATLNAQLMKAIKDNKVENGIAACNLSAMSMIDSLSKKHNATIRRTSHKYRNPGDKPKAYEVDMLETYSNLAREECSPEVQVVDGNKIAYFYPIFVNATCLKCHGEPGSTLDAKAYELIQKIYPNDKAINYRDGEFRGMWSIEFSSNSLAYHKSD